MVRKPKVFLLDEPLSNLDAKLRVEMRSEIVNLHKRLDTTFIYVTHDPVEAMTMGDRIAVLNLGDLEQFDTPLNLYYRPSNKFVAEFIGTPKMNMFETNFKVKDGKLVITLFDQILEIPQSRIEDYEEISLNETYYIGIRSEDFYIDKESGLDLEFFNVEYMGSDIYAYANAEEASQPVVMRFKPEDAINADTQSPVGIDMEKIYVFEKKSEKTVVFPKI